MARFNTLSEAREKKLYNDIRICKDYFSIYISMKMKLCTQNETKKKQ